MKIDLHTHSSASDGKLAPISLLARAAEQNVDVLALTDHDTLCGVRELQQFLGALAKPHPVAFVPGVEITALAGKHTVHVLGLWVDSNDDQLESFLDGQKSIRQQRGEKIGKALEKRGFSGAYEGAVALASDACLARPHFAQFLVDQGHCSNFGQAFRRYLGKGKVGDVKCDWPALGEAVTAIHAAGGLAVLAHPDKYKLTATRTRQLLDDFAHANGDAIEVVSGHQDATSTKYLAGLAARRELACSTGSDFHAAEHYWCELGGQPGLPDGARPVWQGHC